VVVEVSTGAPAESVTDDASGVAALLHRDGREPGKRDRRAVGLADADHVANREHVGVTEEGEVLEDLDAPRAVDFDPGACGQHGGKARCDHAGGPDHGASGDLPGRVVGVFERDGSSIELDHGVFEEGAHPKPRE
jgi:hypothetical protein